MDRYRCGAFTYESGYIPRDGDRTVLVYEFLSPGWLTFVRPGGRIETINYGISERVERLPAYIRHGDDELSAIPCPDGSMIVNWGDDLHMRMVHGEYPNPYRDLDLH
jgi:hypothetical protein